MKNLTMTIIVFLALFTWKTTTTNLRGQILHIVNGKYCPVANTRVDLMFWNGTAWVANSYAITGADGFYYFMNFQPGAKFCILVSGRYYPSEPLQILTVAAPGYQDLPPISM